MSTFSFTKEEAACSKSDSRYGTPQVNITEISTWHILSQVFYYLFKFKTTISVLRGGEVVHSLKFHWSWLKYWYLKSNIKSCVTLFRLNLSGTRGKFSARDQHLTMQSLLCPASGKISSLAQSITSGGNEDSFPWTEGPPGHLQGGGGALRGHRDQRETVQSRRKERNSLRGPLQHLQQYF